MTGPYQRATRKVSQIRGCIRCRRPMRGDETGWNVVVEGGRPVGRLCPNCQTSEENAEAEMNEATLVYERDALGRLTARPKVDLDAAKRDYAVDVIRHCEQVLKEWAQEVADGGEAQHANFEKLARRAVGSLPPQMRPTAAANESVLCQMLKDIWSGEIYEA